MGRIVANVVFLSFLSLLGHLGCDQPEKKLAQIVVTPALVRLDIGQSLDFEAQGINQEGGPINLPTLNWKVTGSGEIDPRTGIFSASEPGDYVVSACNDTVCTIEGTATVKVSSDPPVLTSIAVTPASSQLKIGDGVDFEAQGKDQDGFPMDLHDTLAWTVSGGGTIDPQTGFFTAEASGEYTVDATVESIRGQASVIIFPLPVASLTADPLTIDIGNPSTLTWNVQHATAITIDGDRRRRGKRHPSRYSGN